MWKEVGQISLRRIHLLTAYLLQNQENYLGDALGQLYVEKYYSNELKVRHEKLVDNIISSYQDRIKKLDWMSDSTKEKTLHKLNSITKKVGYPVKWKDYSNYPEYPQAHPPFDHGVTILDLLFNVGPEAPRYIWGWRDEGASP